MWLKSNATGCAASRLNFPAAKSGAVRNLARPMSATPATRELYERYVIPTYARFDLKLARGCGSEVWDEDGKRYLDFGAGIAVTSIGHCHPRVVRMMQEQIATLVHASNLYF